MSEVLQTRHNSEDRAFVRPKGRPSNHRMKTPTGGLDLKTGGMSFIREDSIATVTTTDGLDAQFGEKLSLKENFSVTIGDLNAKSRGGRPIIRQDSTETTSSLITRVTTMVISGGSCDTSSNIDGFSESPTRFHNDLYSTKPNNTGTAKRPSNPGTPKRPNNTVTPERPNSVSHAGYSTRSRSSRINASSNPQNIDNPKAPSAKNPPNKSRNAKNTNSRRTGDRPTPDYNGEPEAYQKFGESSKRIVMSIGPPEHRKYRLVLDTLKNPKHSLANHVGLIEPFKIPKRNHPRKIIGVAFEGSGDVVPEALNPAKRNSSDSWPVIYVKILWGIDGEISTWEKGSRVRRFKGDWATSIFEKAQQDEDDANEYRRNNPGKE